MTDTAQPTFGIIGAGNMATAILRGMLEAGVAGAGEVVAADPDAARRRAMASACGVRCTGDNRVPAACPRLLLGVKPAVVEGVLREIAPAVRADATVVSIAAGITTGRIDTALGGRGRIVRVMPNTPMLVGCGASALAAGPRATQDDLEWTRRVFSAAGLAVVVEEALLDAVTGLSGSGPAYFFYFVEAMIAGARAEGLPEELATRLAVQTCIGAGELLARSGESPQALRRKVTTPGGTTEAAIAHLEAGGAGKTMAEAVARAAERSRTLGTGADR
jgi:pyrroline-5-carboxylate reductase